MTPVAIGSGRFMTAVAIRYQVPCSTGPGSLRLANESESMRRPTTARSAGRTVSEKMPASDATATPAYANDLRKPIGNTSSAMSEAATVPAEKATVRPAVRTVRTTAGNGSWPCAISSRNRLTTKRE